MFNSAVARIIGPFAVPPAAHDAPKYTLPAFEVRRLLEETRASGQAFELTYTQLKGNNPDTRWLGSGAGRTIQLVEDGAKGNCCTLDLLVFCAKQHTHVKLADPNAIVYVIIAICGFRSHVCGSWSFWQHRAVRAYRPAPVAVSYTAHGAWVSTNLEQLPDPG